MPTQCTCQCSTFSLPLVLGKIAATFISLVLFVLMGTQPDWIEDQYSHRFKFMYIIATAVLVWSAVSTILIVCYCIKTFQHWRYVEIFADLFLSLSSLVSVCVTAHALLEQKSFKGTAFYDKLTGITTCWAIDMFIFAISALWMQCCQPMTTVRAPNPQ